MTGQSVTFSVAITSTGQTPTGKVTLLDGTTTIGTFTLQSGGVGSFSISTLTSGSHNITASYAGDSQNAASVSAVLVQIVHDQLAATATTLSSAASPTAGGAPVHLTATVSVITAKSGNGPISGSVAIKQGANTLGVANINAASATDSTATASIALTNLPVGTDSLVAVYSGSSSYASSTSVPLLQIVQLASSTVVLTSATNPSNAGAGVALTATLTSTGGTPTGSVTFLDGANTLGTAPINASGVAVLSAPGHFFTVGVHTLTAVYAGDPNNTGSTSAPLPQVVNIASSTTSVASSLNPSGLGASITFTATVSTNGGTPTGIVKFFDATTLLGPGTLTSVNGSSATATFTTSSLTVATHPITAVYSGDSFDSPSTSPSLSQVVQNATDGVTLSSSAASIVFGSPLTLTATVSGDGSTPTGTVALLDGASTVASLPVPANGIVIFVNPALAIGSHTLTAVYSGDTNHASVTSSALPQIIQQATTTVLASSSASLVAGKSATLTVKVVGVSGKPFTGSVKLLDAGALLATVTPDATGSAAFTTTNLTPARTLSRPSTAAIRSMRPALHRPSASPSPSPPPPPRSPPRPIPSTPAQPSPFRARSPATAEPPPAPSPSTTAAPSSPRCSSPHPAPQPSPSQPWPPASTTSTPPTRVTPSTRRAPPPPSPSRSPRRPR